MAKTKKRKSDRRGFHQPNQLSHAELKVKLAGGDWQTALEQLKRAEQKVGYMTHSGRTDAAERIDSANYTSKLVTEYVSPNLDAGVKVRQGGKKGAELAHGLPEERKARELQVLEWYAAQKRSIRANGKPPRDSEVLQHAKGRNAISGRTLSRLKKKYAKHLKALISPK